MTGRRRILQGFGGGLAAASLSLAGCARMPSREAAGTPVAQVSATGFAALHLGGAPRGAAVGFDECHVLTCAHVLTQGGAVTLRRGLDGEEAPALAVLRSRRMDLAVLRVPAGFLEAPPRATDAPRSGEAVWAAGAPGIGHSVAQGVVEAPDAEMPGFGRGFTARMPALMGYSGGPVVDSAGTLMGLTSAMPGGGGASLLAFLTGADLDGLAGADRQVFVLSIQRASAEAMRLLG
jgi:hypothetical protein